MASVDLQDLRKSFKSVETIKGVSFEVEDGSFVALVGPSGCGKSTLLRMIAGLEEITAGTIRLGGRIINDVEPKNRNIAMVFQNYALYPHMTIAENMGFSLRLAGRPKPEISERVIEAARILGLSDYLARYPRQLSGGQRQRVAMGRAIVRDPEVFLFDEPLSNLDAQLRVQMRAELKQIHARLGTTTIYVTHDQIEAMTMSDFVVVMRDGRIEQAGRPLDLFDRPANTFVAGFLGSPSMNLLQGAASEDGASFVAADGSHIALPEPVAPGRPLTCGIRPEHLTPGHEGEGLRLAVVNVDPTGSETLILGDLAGTPVSVVIHERVALDPGDLLWVRCATRHLHLFDADGARLPI